MSAEEFLNRVFPNVPASPGSSFSFKAWRHAGRPTKEGVGVLPMANVPVDALVSRIMDVASYVGNIDYVTHSRVVPGPENSPPTAVRFYQRINIPMLSAIHMELLLKDFGERGGWRVIAWDQHPATDKLSSRDGARSQYNMGAWLIRPDAVGYALSSAPRKDDVGRLKFAALTKGADAGAPKVVRANIEGMVRWARKG